MVIGQEHRLNPHRFEVSPYDKACGLCRGSRNHWLHQPFWWRWFNPTVQFRN